MANPACTATVKSCGSCTSVSELCDQRRSHRLFKRCDNPTLPNNGSVYAQAKRLEYDGEIGGAMELLFKAMNAGERVDSCMKDIAGLLNMMGRTYEAVAFLRAHSDKVVNHIGYTNLLVRLEAEMEKEYDASGQSCLPRSVTITLLDNSLGPVTMGLCDRLFPNPAKICRILHLDDLGLIGAVHFASHSSARKALQIQKLCGDQVACAWSDTIVGARLCMLERIEREDSDLLDTLTAVIKDELPKNLSNLLARNVPIYKDTDPNLPQVRLADISPSPPPTTPVTIKGGDSTSDNGSGYCMGNHSTTPTSTLSLSSISDSLVDTESLSCGKSPVTNRLSNLVYAHGRLVYPVRSKFRIENDAFVIPFAIGSKYGAEDSADSMRDCAATLSVLSSAMTTIASRVGKTGTVAMNSPKTPNFFATPVKYKKVVRAGCHYYSTPSPVIVNGMFT